MTLTNLAVSSVNARNFCKFRRANKEFKKISLYGRTLADTLRVHVNGNFNQPLRKTSAFIEHNTAKELALIGKMSETARFLQETDGISRELCHLVPLSRSGEISKVNNASNMVIMTRTANQIVNRRAVTREDAEVIDRLVLARKVDEARKYASARCY